MIDGVHFVRRKRPGKPLTWYVYAWRGGPCIMRAENPSKPKLTGQALQALIEAREELQISKETLSGLARDWRYRSPEWAALASSTQKTWGSQLSAIEDKWGTT